MRLLLFDIDGTLIDGDSAGRLAMSAAMEEMFGTRGDLDTYDMGGKTDSRIVSDVLQKAGVAEEVVRQQLPYFFALMAEHAKRIYPQRQIRPCPGVENLLARLGRRDNILVGLLTGNAEPTAHLKLDAAGINPDLFVVGAFGSDAFDRDDLPAIALERASTLTGLPITGDNAIIIGDTPADVQCARAGGALAVAVASGWHAKEVLASCRPDYLFSNLSDSESVLRVLCGEEEDKVYGQ